MIGSNDYSRVTGSPGREDKSVSASRSAVRSIAPMAAPVMACPPDPAGWHTVFNDLYIHGGLFGEAAHITTDGASTLNLGVAATPGAINLNGVGGSSVALQPALSGNTTFTFPATNGAPNQVLSTDGFGNTSWVNSGGSSYTVGTLPTPTVTGMRAYVTDASAPTFLGTVVGGGAVTCPVFFDGTNWVAG